MRKIKKMVDLLTDMLESKTVDHKVEYINLTQDLLNDFRKAAMDAKIEKFTNTSYANLQMNGIKKLGDVGWEYKRLSRVFPRKFTGVDGEIKTIFRSITVYQFIQTNKL